MSRQCAMVLLVVLAFVMRAAAGEITGTLEPPGGVVSVKAVDRDAPRTFTGTYDRDTGKYHLTNLPAGTYDVILETGVGRIEGVNLAVEQTAPPAEPMNLKPSELDKGEIAAITAYLVDILRVRTGKTLSPDWLSASIRETKMTAVRLGKDASGGNGAVQVEVSLKEDERPQVGDMLLGLITLAKVRDRLGRDFDLLIDVRQRQDGEVVVQPVPSELTDKDRTWLIDWVDKLKIFENKKRVLDLEGTGERARVLVEKLRDQPTSLPTEEPTAFWRVEVFDFRKYYGGWNKEKYTVIVRQQVPLREFRAYRWMFEKRLGGIRVSADGVTTVPTYRVPEKLDPSRGRVSF